MTAPDQTMTAPDQAMIDPDQAMTTWTEKLIHRYGQRGAAERLSLSKGVIDRFEMDRHANLTTWLAESIDIAMTKKPQLGNPSSGSVPSDPRNKSTLPLLPYPDEPLFFGIKTTLRASKWRETTERVVKLSGQNPRGVETLRQRELLLTLEIELLKKENMTLASEQIHSQAVNSPTLRRRERWEWRENDLTRITAEREALEAKMNRRKLIRRLFSPLTRSKP